MDYEKLCKEADEVSKAKGWQDVPRSFDGDIALIHEELSEALGEYRSHKGLDESYYELTVVGFDGKKTTDVFSAKEKREREDSVDLAGRPLIFKPCGIPSELADVVIRIAQYCGTNKVNLPSWMANISIRVWPREYLRGLVDFEVFIRYAHKLVAAVENDASQHERFAWCVKYVADFCASNKVDLDSTIAEKMGYNKTREYRHGGRKI